MGPGFRRDDEGEIRCLPEHLRMTGLTATRRFGFRQDDAGIVSRYRAPQNIVLLFAGFSGTGCTTSQCSTILPSSSLKMSTIALPRVPGSRTA